MTNVGEGYRQLEPGKDVLQRGDERQDTVIHRSYRYWEQVPATMHGQWIEEKSLYIYRRPLSRQPVEQEDE